MAGLVTLGPEARSGNPWHGLFVGFRVSRGRNAATCASLMPPGNLSMGRLICPKTSKTAVLRVIRLFAD